MVITKPDTSANSTAATFTFSSDEAGATFECKLDGGAWAACTSPVTFSGLAEGQHTLQVRAGRRRFYQRDAAPKTYSWTVDTTAPATPAIASAPSSPAQSSTFRVHPCPPVRPPSAVGRRRRVDGLRLSRLRALRPRRRRAHVQAPLRSTARATVSEPTVATWTLDTAAPGAPALIGATEGNVTAKTAEFVRSGEAGGLVRVLGRRCAAFAPAPRRSRSPA